MLIVFLISRQIILHIKDAPRREAEKVLREGRIVDGLGYFWQQGDFARISRFIEQELPLPDTNWWGRFWRADPQFRRLISENYAALLSLMFRATDKGNIVISEEMRFSTFCHTSHAAHYLFSTCQQLSFMARNGEVLIKNNDLRPSFIDIARRLETFQAKVLNARTQMDKYVLAPHQTEWQMTEIFKDFDDFADTIQQGHEIEAEIMKEFFVA